MKIAIASGKGGTGKTLVATNLAWVASRNAEVALYDLDVEEPNCHLFLEADGSEERTPVPMMIPRVVESRCSHCGACSELCEFHAIVTLPGQVLVFPELCHGCQGCLELCPEGAIEEGSKQIGEVTVRRNGALTLVAGELAVGEPLAAALVGKTRQWPCGPAALRLYDSPPGTSCPVIEAVKDANYVVLVAEPTRFGLHDLDLMTKTLRQLERPFGVVVNKVFPGDEAVETYCCEQGIETLLRIPWSRDVARDTARGLLVAETIPEVREQFEALLKRLPATPTGVRA
jgi:MinD superfamily P-loop ATPase